MAGVGAIYQPSPPTGALRQGEILSRLAQTLVVVESLGPDRELEIDFKEHPLVLIMSQDCDLDQDYHSRQPGADRDRTIPNILFCEVTDAYTLRNRPAAQLAAGTSGQAAGKEFTSDMWRRVRQNKDERYHFLQKVQQEEDRLGEGLPELGIDFKRYFTIPTAEVYHQIQTRADRRCRLRSPYLEHLGIRFHAYQQRIALPEEHFSEPG